MNLNAPQWDILYNLYLSNKEVFGDFKLDMRVYNKWMRNVYVISELIDGKGFRFFRDSTSKERRTVQDDFGCVGFSSIQPSVRELTLTEGVSDFISYKFSHPKDNVLGMTTLGGNFIAKNIVSWFDNLTIIGDNDVDSCTGMRNALNMKRFYEGLGKHVKVYIPSSPFKDYTDEFLFNLRIKD